MNTSLLTLNRDILKGRANGKTIWQPRIGCWYDDRIFRGEDLPGRFKGSDRKSLYEKLGCSDRLYYFNSCLEHRYVGEVEGRGEKLDERTTKHTLTTPVGEVTTVMASNTSNPGIMPRKWWIETEEDIKVFTYLEEISSYSFNMDTYGAMYADLAHLGLPVMFLPRVNIQNMFINLAGVENTIYLLNDCPDTVHEFFRVMGDSQAKMTRVVADSPIEWINYGDNLHCKILPPEMFKRYVLPEYQRRGDILHAAGKFTFSHWDGDVRDYLPFARECFLDGIEAITPLPQGDVTLEETKAALGNDIFLIDGLAAVLFGSTYPVEHLERQTRQALELFEGQLILGISDELPSDGLLERVELVGEIVDKFNAMH